MRIRLWLVLACVLAVTSAHAQETRGTIAGTVQDAQGVLPGASVRITNVDTGVSTTVVTNASGYYEAPLLLPGNYQLTAEMPNFKTLVRSGIVLGVAQRLDVVLTLELGAVTEQVTVTAEAPLLDTSSVASGQSFERRYVDSLPQVANMPVLLTRYVAGVNSSANVPWVAQGYVNRTSQDTSSPGGVGGNEWTIDGVTNAGSDRRLASSPNSDMIQEMRIETANFDATFGHGTGLGISMMTRAGTNTPRTTINYQHWNAHLNSANPFQKRVFETRPDVEAAFLKGRSHNFATTFGGPVYVPNVIDGRNKLFMFLNLSYSDDYRAGQTGGNNTIPSEAHRNGDFSDLLAIGPRYQIYDPLTVRPDPDRPGRFIRDPFPNNIIPRERWEHNALYRTYTAFLPTPNNPPANATLEPTNNYLSAAEPDPITSLIWGARVDYNLNERHRFFSRVSGSDFNEGLGDWTYESKRFLHSADTNRKTWAVTANWTNVRSASTVLDAQFSANRYQETEQRLGTAAYKPTDVGLPAYLDQQCTLLGSCQLPIISVAGYRQIGLNGSNTTRTTNLQGVFNVSQVRGQHTLRAGADYRQHYRVSWAPNASSGEFIFSNLYTRKNDDTAVAPAGDLGLAWAAFMLGIPTSSEVDQQAGFRTDSPYFGLFVQDAWRVSQKLTVNLGLRFEYENGIIERDGAALVGFDPNVNLTISNIAEAAYASRPVPELPANLFDVRGGAIYSSASGLDGRTWKGETMWMPRASFAWQPTSGTVVKGGYGLYYDTLNASSFSPNQLGYSTTTSSPVSFDHGQTWNYGDPARGILPITDPFPLRPDGTRFESPYRDTLGPEITSGTNFTYGNLDRTRARMQRWRFSVQRELGRNNAVEVAWVGSFADRVDVNVRQNYLPEQYWNHTLERNNALASNLNSNVPNPFFIGNFEALRTSDPLLYARLESTPYFTSPTIQKHQLLRPFPHFSNLTAGQQPIGKVKTNGVEINFQRRFAQGLTANVAYVGMRAKEWTTIVNEWERAPTQWISTQNARPHRLTGGWVYELPFGESRAFLSDGSVLSKIVGGWQTGATFEYQPGALLQWGNLFFYGNLDDIALDKPCASPAGDPTCRWFNVDAGFERNSARAPAGFQARVFPFRVDGVRGPSTKLLNVNFQRTFSIGGARTIQARVDIANFLNRTHYGNPNLTPTSTDFGRISSATSTSPRFFTFILKATF